MRTDEPERRRLRDRQRSVARAAADGGLSRVARGGYRWSVVLLLAAVGCALLVQGLFAGSVLLTATGNEASWAQAGSAAMQSVAGLALLALALWLVQSQVLVRRGLLALAALTLLSAPPWGWFFGDAGHMVGMLLLLGVVVTATRVHWLSRSEPDEA